MNFWQTLVGSSHQSSLHQMMIWLHVATALGALAVAPVAMIARKTGRTHKQWGRVYFWSMVVTNLTALGLLYWRFNPFLYGVTILSLYGAMTAYRVMRRKQVMARQGPTWFDWFAAYVALISGVGLILWGGASGLGLLSLWIPSGGSPAAITTILPVLFGLSTASDAWRDLRRFRRPSTEPLWWWYYHMERILGSYIALVTALMVQQVGPRMPEPMAWIAWVAPAAIGTPAIAYWIGRYRRRFARKESRSSRTVAAGDVTVMPPIG